MGQVIAQPQTGQRMMSALSVWTASEMPTLGHAPAASPAFPARSRSLLRIRSVLGAASQSLERTRQSLASEDQQGSQFVSFVSAEAGTQAVHIWEGCDVRTLVAWLIYAALSQFLAARSVSQARDSLCKYPLPVSL